MSACCQDASDSDGEILMASISVYENTVSKDGATKLIYCPEMCFKRLLW